MMSLVNDIKDKVNLLRVEASDRKVEHANTVVNTAAVLASESESQKYLDDKQDYKTYCGSLLLANFTLQDLLKINVPSSHVLDIKNIHVSCIDNFYPFDSAAYNGIVRLSIYKRSINSYVYKVSQHEFNEISCNINEECNLTLLGGEEYTIRLLASIGWTAYYQFAITYRIRNIR